MNPNTDEARRLASELRSVIPPKNHEASRILDSAAFTLRLLAADVNKLEAELAETKEGWRLAIEQHRVNVMPETESAVHIAELEAENEALREHNAPMIDCLAGKLTSYDQIFGYLCKLEMENESLERRRARLADAYQRTCDGMGYPPPEGQGDATPIEWANQLRAENEALRAALESIRVSAR